MMAAKYVTAITFSITTAYPAPVEEELNIDIGIVIKINVIASVTFKQRVNVEN